MRTDCKSFSLARKRHIYIEASLGWFTTAVSMCLEIRGRNNIGNAGTLYLKGDIILQSFLWWLDPQTLLFFKPSSQCWIHSPFTFFCLVICPRPTPPPPPTFLTIHLYACLHCLVKLLEELVGQLLRIWTKRKETKYGKPCEMNLQIS